MFALSNSLFNSSIFNSILQRCINFIFCYIRLLKELKTEQNTNSPLVVLIMCILYEQTIIQPTDWMSHRDKAHKTWKQNISIQGVLFPCATNSDILRTRAFWYRLNGFNGCNLSDNQQPNFAPSYSLLTGTFQTM